MNAVRGSDPLSKLEHRGLRYFAVAVEFESVSLAADHLGISQPALSKAISRLENDLGTTLLQRVRGGVRPTEAGRLVLDYASRSQREVADLMGELTKLRTGSGGSLRVGATADWIEGILPNALVALRAREDDFDAQVSVLASNRLQEALREGTIDLYFGPTMAEEHTPEFDFQTLATDWSRVYAGPGNRVFDEPLESLADLLERPWILTRPDTFMRRSLIRLFAAHGLPAPRPVLSSNSVTLLTELTSQGDFLTFLSDIAAHPFGNTTLQRVPLDAARAQRQKGVVTRKGEQLSPMHEALVDAVKVLLVSLEEP
jgi:DNA-binding transcriptional LysR family regulator